MKENALVGGVTGPGIENQRSMTPRNKAQKRPAGDAVNFSPERIKDQESTKSTVLIKMLEREEATYYSRHWGINE